MTNIVPIRKPRDPVRRRAPSPYGNLLWALSGRTANGGLSLTVWEGEKSCTVGLSAEDARALATAIFKGDFRGGA